MILDVSVAVFCQNEAAHIGACLASIAAAAAGLRVGLTIIANGSTDGSGELALRDARRLGLAARAYTIAHGDKANAINHSFRNLREPARIHVFADGYTVIGRDALSALASALAANPNAVAATGVASNGRTMAAATEATLRHGSHLHGQLHAFRPAFLDRLVQRGLGLPVGLYRGDGLLGSMACHDLDPIGNPWDGHRIQGVAAATYAIPRLSPFRPADIRRQFRRKVRQMRGRLENEAIKSIIYRNGYAALPDNADDMIAAWLAEGGTVRASLPDRPFLRLALSQHAAASRPTGESLQPQPLP
jgi:glycosyltransferase involved in cell wall biosynthesis